MSTMDKHETVLGLHKDFIVIMQLTPHILTQYPDHQFQTLINLYFLCLNILILKLLSWNKVPKFRGKKREPYIVIMV